MGVVGAVEWEQCDGSSESGYMRAVIFKWLER